MGTVLAFRTPVGSVSIPAGQTKELGTVDVSAYSRIRVVADERSGAGTGVSIRLTDPAQADWRFTGNFEKENIRQALEALKLTANFNYIIQGNQIQIITNK